MTNRSADRSKAGELAASSPSQTTQRHTTFMEQQG